MEQINGKVRFCHVFINLSIPLLIGRNQSIPPLISGNQPPWDENWVLDEKFFRQMEAWETEHPESTFAKVIKKVNSAVTTCQPFLEHIPESPFPARSLIKGLAYLLQLGTVRAALILATDRTILQIYMQTITSAKKDVYDFTMQVLSWFSAVEAPLRGRKKKFANQATKNLTVIR